MGIGVREFRNSLSRYLDDVKRGETITVTDHGRPIAEVRPTGRTFDQLVAEGRITSAKRPGRPTPAAPLRVPGIRLSDILDEQRRQSR